MKTPDQKKNYWIHFLPFIFLLLFVLPSFAFIKATPNPVVFTSDTQTPGMTTIQWDAGTVSKAPYEVDYSTNSGAETLFASGKQGMLPANFIVLNNVYKFCLWGNNKAKRIDCVTVKTQLSGGGTVTSGDFIKDVNVDPGLVTAKFNFSTTKTSLPVVMVSKIEPLPFDPVSSTDQKVFETSDLAGANFASPGKSHKTQIGNLEPAIIYYYVIAANDPGGSHYKVQGQFETKPAVLYSSVTLKPDYGFADLSFNTNISCEPIVQISTNAPNNVEPLSSDEPLNSFFNPKDVISGSLSARKGTAHSAHMSGLGVSTHYYYVISALQTIGGVRYWSNYQGEFDTPKMRKIVTVTFTELLITDPKDEYRMFGFDFCVNGKELRQGDVEENAGPFVDRKLSISETVTDPPDTMNIKVVGLHPDLGTAGAGLYGDCTKEGAGKDKNGDWNTASYDFHTSDSIPFALLARAPASGTPTLLEFTVHGKIEVRYEKAQ